MLLALKDKAVLVLGLGATGMSMARFAARYGARVRVADTRETPPFAAQLRGELPQAELHAGPLREDSFAGIDLVAISPGVALAEPPVSAALKAGMRVVGDIELFARIRGEFPGAKVVAITGSNGKSTVTEMVGAMCKAAGVRTLVAGNIGLPVLDAAIDIQSGRRRRPDIFVLELSSFQLETTQSLNAEAAAVLNLSEDHLDRYPSMREYAQAKSRIYLGDGVQVINRDDPLVRDMAIPDRSTLTFGFGEPGAEGEFGLRSVGNDIWLAQGDTALMTARDLRVAGLHNAANALAALALCRAIDLPFPPLLNALRDFRGLPHRVQKIADVGGVSFYDDSKGTNVGATVAALRGLQQPVVAILGGDGKGQDFSPLRQAVSGKVRAIVLIGRDRESIARAIEGAGARIERAANMYEAVRRAYALARPGDAVLLSPACASFDMFRNYAHRAEVFVDAVKALGA
ncbi:MAG TPA: UDP-N-acetylmuramoyl-L-alanine--D-glutamate ligase [Burkholderiales bacterium]|nr:UDP-N-acetylmuramoyl-L-alanine--D-glutamate ligase [Burkholderiales bacterium]